MSEWIRDRRKIRQIFAIPRRHALKSRQLFEILWRWIFQDWRDLIRIWLKAVSINEHTEELKLAAAKFVFLAINGEASVFNAR